MTRRSILICSFLLLASLPARATINGKPVYVKRSTVPASVVKRFEAQFEAQGATWTRTCPLGLMTQAQMEEYRGPEVWTHVVDKIDDVDRLNGLTRQEGWLAYHSYSREYPDELGQAQWSLWHATPELQYNSFEAKTINGVRTGHDINDRGCKPGLDPKVGLPLFGRGHHK